MRYDDQTLGSLGTLLNLPDLGGEDWDLMYADPERVQDFCDVYKNEKLSEPEKFALMALLVASHDR